MKATTKIQAERIAAVGAAKMSADKYTIKGSTLKSLRGVQFTVVNNETA
jgi:hypothetical protein